MPPRVKNKAKKLKLFFPILYLKLIISTQVCCLSFISTEFLMFSTFFFFFFL